MMHTLLRTSLIATLLAASTAAHAGANNATLRCQAGRGAAAVTLEGDVPGDFDEAHLTYTAKGVATRLAGSAHAVTDFARKVVAYTVITPDAELILYAVPRTLEVTHGARGATHARFDAVLRLQSRALGSTTETLRCTYDYSI